MAALALATGAHAADSPLTLWEKTDNECATPPKMYAAGACYYIDPRIGDFKSEVTTLRFPLADTNLLTVERATWSSLAGDAFCWQGILPPGGYASFASFKGRLAGEIRTTDGRRFRVRTGPDGRYIVEELDPGQLNPTDESRRYEPQKADSPKDLRACPAGKDRPGRIDIVFGVTAAVVNKVGSLDQVEAQAQLATCQANWAYRDSRLDIQLRSLGIEQIEFDENQTAGPNGPLLSAQEIRTLIKAGTGKLKKLRDFRDEKGADFGAFIIDRDGLGGNAQQFQESFIGDPGAFSANAYAIISGFMLTESYMLAHELGHMMGANHDHDSLGVDHGASATSRAHVHASPEKPELAWKTIMSDTNCPGCARIGRFSTSDKNQKWNDEALGSRAEDNSRTLQATAATVANFRCSTVPLPDGPPVQ